MTAPREVSLFLKYPGSNIALQRLQHSFLECVVEHKSGTYEEFQSYPPSYLKSDYQLKGTASLEDDEIVITFLPKHSGLHTVRIFADTRELCKPVAFIVTQNFEVESTPINRPMKPTSSLLRQMAPSPAPSMAQSYQQQQMMTMMNTGQLYGTQAQRAHSAGERGGGGGGYSSGIENSLQHLSVQNDGYPQQQQHGVDGGFTSDPAFLSQSHQSGQFHEGDGRGGGGGGGFQQASLGQQQQQRQQQRYSYAISGQGSRPSSMARDEQAFAGDLMSMTPEKSSFNELYLKKQSGDVGPNVRKTFLMMDHSKVVTPETFEALNSDISQLVGSKGIKTKRR